MALADLPDPRALLFDLDGTVVDTVPVRIGAWVAALQEAGIPADRAQVAELVGSDGRVLARQIASRAGRQLSDDEAERLDHRAGELHEAANVDPRPLPGARELLLGLTGSPIRWAIATSSRRAQVRTSVEALHLMRRPIVVDGTHVAQAKPAPDLLLLAARRLSVAPESCWYVGDARWDMLAAVAAGMVPVGVTSGAADARTLRAAGAAAVVPDLTPITADLRRRGALA
ncbi:MAG TPA: HAD family hydrolase [Candidatus Baltobacteraceae bacterium]|nr:HAD family hydrolase [Candidatus Baltobacteraceae bacterium]